jgi:hypothetical protein
MQSNQSSSEKHIIPDGYVLISSNHGQEYVVPQFMVPATHQALEAYQKKLDLDVANAAGGVSTQLCYLTGDKRLLAGQYLLRGRCR